MAPFGTTSRMPHLGFGRSPPCLALWRPDRRGCCCATAMGSTLRLLDSADRLGRAQALRRHDVGTRSATPDGHSRRSRSRARHLGDDHRLGGTSHGGGRRVLPAFGCSADQLRLGSIFSLRGHYPVRSHGHGQRRLADRTVPYRQHRGGRRPGTDRGSTAVARLRGRNLATDDRCDDARDGPLCGLRHGRVRGRGAGRAGKGAPTGRSDEQQPASGVPAHDARACPRTRPISRLSAGSDDAAAPPAQPEHVADHRRRAGTDTAGRKTGRG